MKSSTFSDLEGHRQPVRLAILATAGFLFYTVSGKRGSTFVDQLQNLIGSSLYLLWILG